MRNTILSCAALLVSVLCITSCQKNEVTDPELTLNNTLAATASTTDLTGKIVFNELYFNVKSPSFWEEYFTITNISNEVLDLTGLSFAITTDFANGSTITLYNNAKNAGQIYVSQIYTIPGQKLLNPDETLVIAHSAINHISTHSGTVNLTGADYEIYILPNDGSSSMTTDQSAVPNLTVNLSHFQAFHWQTTGSSSLIMFKYNKVTTATEPTLNAYISAKLETNLPHPTAPTGTIKLTGVKIPASWILDAQSAIGGQFPSASFKILPNTIDASFIKTQLDLSDYNGWMWKRKKTGGVWSNNKSSALDFAKHTTANSYL